MSQTILLVDDEPIAHELSSKVIRSVFPDASILRFFSVEEAYKEIVEKIQEFKSDPPIIFLDIMMPEADGFEFLERLSGPQSYLFESFKVIMLTSSISQHDKDRAFFFPHVSSYLEKPLNRQALTYLKLWD